MNDTMDESKDASVVVMNFTHVYEAEHFYKKGSYQWVDCTELNGVYGYCDSVATEQIKSKIECMPAKGIHFIDSGNFHYVSKFWMDKIKEPFALVLFDHHTDMMASRFGDLLSCGSWAREALDHNTYLKKIILIGADDTLVDGMDGEYRDRISYFSTAYFNQEQNWKAFADRHISVPLYISVDKDVLSPKEEPTDWDQGTMTLKVLEQILHILIRDHQIIGIDITGESTNLLEAGSKAVHMNDTVNQKLLHFLMSQKRQPNQQIEQNSKHGKVLDLPNTSVLTGDVSFT